MILTDKRIRELAESSELITPFAEENLQSESYTLLCPLASNLHHRDVNSQYDDCTGNYHL